MQCKGYEQDKIYSLIKSGTTIIVIGIKDMHVKRFKSNDIDK